MALTRPKPNTVSVVQASEDALTAWIASQLTDVTVNSEWPDPAIALPPHGSISVLRVGKLLETSVTPYPLKRVDHPYDNFSDFYFKTANCEQSLQLEVWATSKPRRDDIQNRLFDALTAGKGQTLSAACLASYGAPTNQDAVELGISLQMAPPWDHLVATYLFDAPEIEDSPDAVKRREFRASYQGTAWFDRTTVRTLPRLSTITVPVTAGPSVGPATPSAASPTVTITPGPAGAPPTKTIT